MTWLADKVSTWFAGENDGVDPPNRAERLMLAALVVRGCCENAPVDLSNASKGLLCVVVDLLIGRASESQVYDAFDRVQESYVEGCGVLGENRGDAGAWADAVYTACYCVLWEVYVSGGASGSVAEDDMPAPVAEGDDGLWLDLVEMLGRVRADEREGVERWVASGFAEFASGGTREVRNLLCSPQTVSGDDGTR